MAKAASSLADNLEKHLECAVCLEQYNEPKVLPCLHTFCKTCLQGLLTKQGDVWKVVCPTCRADAEVLNGVIDSLPVNFFVNNLLSVVALHEDSEAGNLECDNCASADPPVSRCTTCCHFLCEFCTQAHQRGRKTTTHQLMSLEEAKKSGSSAIGKPSLCKEHEEEMLKLFCETCEEAICRDCTIVKHRDHKYVFVKDGFFKSKEDVLKMLEETKKQALVLKQALEGVSDMKRSVQSHAEKTREEVKDCFNKLSETLEVRHQELISDIEDFQKVKMKSLKRQQEEMEMALGSVTSSIEFTERAFENGSQVEVLNMKKQMENRLQELNATKWELEPCTDDAFVFKTDDKLQEAVSTFGVISDIATCARASVVTVGHGSEGVVYNPLCGQPLEFTVIAKERNGRKRVEGGDVCKVEIQDPELGPGESKAVDVRDCKDGTYTFKYTPTGEGQYHMTVKLNDSTVQGRPFTWNAKKWNLMQPSPSNDVQLSGGNANAERLTAQKVDHYGYSQYSRIVSGSVGFSTGQHSWKVKVSSGNWNQFGLGCYGAQLRASGNCISPQTGNQWTWFSGSRKYQPSSGVQQSLITVYQSNDVIEVYLDCDNNKLLMYNQHTKQSDTWEGVQGEVFPVFYLIYNGDMFSLQL